MDIVKKETGERTESAPPKRNNKRTCSKTSESVKWHLTGDDLVDFRSGMVHTLAQIFSELASSSAPSQIQEVLKKVICINCSIAGL